jgi:hypothetical protein
MLANPTAQPKRRRHTTSSKDRAIQKRTHTERGGDGEGLSDSDEERPWPKHRKLEHITGPMAQTYPDIEEEVGSSERSQGKHGPPPPPRRRVGLGSPARQDSSNYRYTVPNYSYIENKIPH